MRKWMSERKWEWENDEKKNTLKIITLITHPKNHEGTQRSINQHNKKNN